MNCESQRSKFSNDKNGVLGNGLGGKCTIRIGEIHRQPTVEF